MFLEFAYNMLNLNFVWIFDVIMNNLHYLFGFALLMYYFTDGKNAFRGFVILVFEIWAVLGWIDVFGWVGLVGGFLAINYIVKVALLTFIMDDPKLAPKLFWVNEIAAFTVWALYNFYAMGYI